MLRNCDFGKLTSKKVLYVIALTSIFWLSMNVLLLIANNEAARESLEQLALTSNVRVDSHYMKDNIHIQPLEAVHKPFNLPWLNEDYWGDKENKDNQDTLTKREPKFGEKLLFVPGHRPLYDISARVNIHPMLGEGGVKAVLETEEEKKFAESVFKNHSFNSVLSDKISLDRTMKDVRGEACIKKHETYPVKLPTVSVIICFHNEAYSVLVRTVHSVLNRTPPDLLVDVILVDDKSEYGTIDIEVPELRHQPLETYLFPVENLGRPLDEHIKELSKKVQVVRNAKRSGLIKSRLAGAVKATGEVLIFLDSHCETTPGWVEPLLARVAEKKSNVVVPVIEVLNSDTLEYQAAANPDQRGGFSWDLFYKWKPIPMEEQKLRSSPIDVIRTPAMAGGLFGIHREYFYEMGSYDEQMDIWGGENLEMSFRIWMCGGRIDIIPCSRVGHIFRKYTSPYKFPDGVEKTLAKNLNRLAEVWMDEYKELYYQKRPHAKGMPYGDISGRVALREKLKCHNFKWYIDNVYPDIQMPDLYPPAKGEEKGTSQDVDVKYQVRNPASNYCLDSMGDVKGNDPKHKLGVFPCHGQGGNQHFVFSKKGEIIFDEEHCLDVSDPSPGASIEILKCHNFGGNQRWIHERTTGVIRHHPTQNCIDRGTNDRAIMRPCNGKPAQHWVFSSYNTTSFILQAIR